MYLKSCFGHFGFGAKENQRGPREKNGDQPLRNLASVGSAAHPGCAELLRCSTFPVRSAPAIRMRARPQRCARAGSSQIKLRDGGSVETLDGAVDDAFLCQVRGGRGCWSLDWELGSWCPMHHNARDVREAMLTVRSRWQVCMEVFVEPTSGCPQGHACCRTCYESVREGEQQKCPACRHPTSTANLVRQRVVEQLLNKTLVRCKNAEVGDNGAAGNGEQGPASKRARISQSAGLQQEGGAGGGAAMEGGAGAAAGGCTWTGRLGDVEAHLKSSCSFELLPCPFSVVHEEDVPSDDEDVPTYIYRYGVCDQLFLRRELEEHAAVCDFRLVPCPHCAFNIRFMNLEDHDENCEEREVECANEGCSVCFKQKCFIIDHTDQCEFQSVACPCPGCETEVLRRDLQVDPSPP